MKVCVYAHDFWPSVGGLQRASEALAGYLVEEAGLDVVVVTSTAHPPGGEPPWAYPVVRAPSRARLVDLLRTCDLVHSSCMSFAAVVAARRAGVPHVLVHSSYSPAMRRSLRDRRSIVSREEAWRIFHALSSRVGMRFAARNVCVSEASLRSLRPPRGTVLHLPVEVGSRFRPMPDVEQSARFAFFGRLVVHKGCDVLVRSLALGRRLGYRLGADVYGEGPDRARLVRLARRHGLDDGAVVFHDFVGGEELARAYNRALAVVVPSLWHEPLGMVAVEAMACGRAVVASDEGGLGELVSGRGLTFPTGDVDALTRRLIELHESAETRRALEEGGPSVAAPFSVARSGRAHLSLYREVVAESSGGPAGSVGLTPS